MTTPSSPVRLKIIQTDKNVIQSVDHPAQEVKLMLPNISSIYNRNVSELGSKLNAGAKV
jgi:hypothetical protein